MNDLQEANERALLNSIKSALYDIWFNSGYKKEDTDEVLEAMAAKALQLVRED